MNSNSQRSAVSFPPLLEQVHVDEQIPEYMGYLPRALGVIAILEALIIFSFPAYIPVRSSLLCIGMVGGLLVAGPLLIWWDFKRHPNPRVFVRREDQVGIYRNRHFEMTIPIGGIRPFRLKRANTAVFIFVAAFVGPLMLYEGLHSFQPVSPSAPPWLKLTAMMVAVALFESVTAFTSYARLVTWTFTLHYKAPQDKNFTMDSVEVSRPDANRLFPIDARSAS